MKEKLLKSLIISVQGIILIAGIYFVFFGVSYLFMKEFYIYGIVAGFLSIWSFVYIIEN